MKTIFPVFWFGFLGLFVVAGAVQGGWKDPMVFVAPLGMAVVGVFVFRMLLWDLLDEVRDGGTFLLVRKGSIEERVRLADVINVSMSQFVNPSRLALRLRRPGKLGAEIVFIPKAPLFRFNPFARNAVAEDLIQRVDRARQMEPRSR